jgi:phosphatidylglycerol:prolipoprotein diacylglycerol transferase
MFQGGLLSALPVAWLLSRANGQGFLGLGDALAPSLALGQGLGRVGCFLAGCCHGRAAPPGFPLALTFPPGGEAPAGIPLYPTQLAESLGLLALAAFLVKRLKGGAFPRGGILGLYLAGTGLLRFVVDFFRGDDRGPAFLGLSPTSYLALGLFLFGLFLCRAPRRGRGAA